MKVSVCLYMKTLSSLSLLSFCLFCSQMEVLMGDSRQSVASLQTQLDDFRERSRKDLLEAQRNSKDRLAELQRAQSNLKTQQEEVRKNMA